MSDGSTAASGRRSAAARDHEHSSTDHTHRHGTGDPAPGRDGEDLADPIGPRWKSVEEVREVYADGAEKMERLSRLNRLLTGRFRREYFGRADGRVLDVACGLGTNVEYLPDDAEYVGIDVSPEMLARAERRYEDLARGEQLREMDAQALAFDDDSFDAVVSSLSTCTFPEPIAALREMERVCRPGGRIYLVEHGQSSVGPVARLLEWRAEAHYEAEGCRLDQEPLELVAAAGLPVEASDRGVLGILTAIEARPRERE